MNKPQPSSNPSKPATPAGKPSAAPSGKPGAPMSPKPGEKKPPMK